MKSFCTKQFNLRLGHRIQRFGLPFYYYWDDFAENYPQNLLTFTEESKYNTEKLLKRQFLGLYTDFFKKEGDTYNFELIKANSEDENGEPLEYYANIEDYSLYLFQNNGDLNIFSEFNKYKPLSKRITTEKTITIYFTDFISRVMHPFFEYDPINEIYNHEVTLNKYLYFTENVEKIVMFLLSDKTFEEWTNSEPTQEPQPVPKIGEAQPTPVVSEEPQPEELQEAKNVLINGRKPNLLERYQIADRIFNIDKTITRLNVRAEDKYKILAVLLDCNEHNAKKLINRKYPAKTDQKAIKDFINKYLPE